MKQGLIFFLTCGLLRHGVIFLWLQPQAERKPFTLLMLKY